MLAEKVENHAEFVAARDQGFVYFQGYFLRRPEMMTTHDVPANAVNYMRMLQAVSQTDLDVPELDKLIKTEASICYRLLRYMNSAASDSRTKFTPCATPWQFSATVRCAAGSTDCHRRRWQIRPAISCSALWSAPRFGELLAPLVRHGESDLFLLGLLSCSMSCLKPRCPKFWRKSRWMPKPKPFFAASPACCAPFTSSCWPMKAGEWRPHAASAITPY